MSLHAEKIESRIMKKVDFFINKFALSGSFSVGYFDVDVRN